MEMSPTKKQLMWIYDRLYLKYGPQKWWPAETEFEVVIGAILTQQAPWTNVEKAINNLKSYDLLEPKRLANTEISLIERLIKPAGFYKVKSKRIKNIARTYDDLQSAYRMSVDEARKRLLAVEGVGPETCDSILLYAGGIPTFVIDAYTKRLAERYGLIEEAVSYDDLKGMFEKKLKPNERLYNEYHALIVQLGKNHCKSNPLCKECPLTDRCEKRVYKKKQKKRKDR